MKTGTALLMAGGAFLAIKLLKLGVAGNVAQIVFNGIQANSPLNYTLNFIVQNVSNTTINFNSMSGAVTLNDIGVGNVSSFPAVPVAIPGNSQQAVNVQLDLSVIGVLGEIQQIVNDTGSVLNFEVKGNFNINNLVLPFDLVQSITV